MKPFSCYFQCRSRLPRILALVVFNLATCGGLRAAEFSITDIGTLGGQESEAYGINGLAHVVGWSTDTNGYRQAFVWKRGTMSGLGFLPGGTASEARAINDHGAITGHAAVSATNHHAFLFQDGVMQDLGTMGGAISEGRAINNKGEIAGRSQVADHWHPQAFVWRSNQFVHLPPFGGWYSSEANDINEEGRVCGITFVWSPNPRWWGFVWYDENENLQHDRGEMKLLGSLAPKDSAGEYSGAMAMNDRGQTAGWTGVTNSGALVHAFLVSASNNTWKIPDTNINPTNALMNNLGTLGGFHQDATAAAINNRGWVVGSATDAEGRPRAVLWRNGAIHDLNDLIPPGSGWLLTHARDINDVDDIVGYGLFNEAHRAFLLQRQGRITRFAPLSRVETSVTTNMAGDFFTQSVAFVESFEICWMWPWVAEHEEPHAYVVEKRDTGSAADWQSIQPAEQWPILPTCWTNDPMGVLRQLFRVRAVDPSGNEAILNDTP